MKLRNEFVCAVVFLGGVDVNNLIVREAGSDDKKPQVPEELELLVRGLEASSAKLPNVFTYSYTSFCG